MSVKYDLEDRTKVFAINVRDFVKSIPRNIYNNEYSKQIIRSSASIGANYREANGALGKRDFLMRLRIARKEAKETTYWIDLIDITNDIEVVRSQLRQESVELMSILSSIISKSE